MSYKFTIKEKQLEEGALEDYYKQMAARQGRVSKFEPQSKAPSTSATQAARAQIAAYNAKKAAATRAEAEKQRAASEAEAEKQRKAAEKQQKDTEKQYARDYAGLEKQDKLDQKAAAQKTIDDARKEIGFLTTITQEMRTATGLDDATLQLALDAITSKYIGRGTLAEADEPDIKPLMASAGSAEFRKYYGDIIDAQAFSDFESARQIIDFLYAYEQSLQKVQDRVKQITGGKQLKINPKLIAAFKKTNKYIEQITGKSAAATTAELEPVASAATPVDTSSTIDPAPAAPAAPKTAPAAPKTAPAISPQGAEDTRETIKTGPQLVNSPLRTSLVELCIKNDADLLAELETRKIITGKMFKKGPYRFVPVGEKADRSIVFPHKKILVKDMFSLNILFNLNGTSEKYEVEKLPVFGAGTDDFPLRDDLIDKGIAAATTTNSIKEDAYSGLFDKFLPKQYKTPNSVPFKPNSYGNFTLKE